MLKNIETVFIKTFKINPKFNDVLRSYVMEIVKNFKANHPNLDTSDVVSMARDIEYVLIKMGEDKKSSEYRKYSKYFPKRFDPVSLVTFRSMNSAQRRPLIKNILETI